MLTSSNLILSNIINEKLIETHELVFRLAVFVCSQGLPNNVCYAFHCVVSIIEQGWIMNNQRKIFTKQNRLHYLDAMVINFILQLYMNDINHCPNITFKHIL